MNTVMKKLKIIGNNPHPPKKHNNSTGAENIANINCKISIYSWPRAINKNKFANKNPTIKIKNGDVKGANL